MRRLRLQLRPGAQWVWACLNVLPLPGVGAMWVGIRNPHSRLLGRGWMQLALVLFGAWPLLLPGLIGLGWAIVDAARIAQAELAPLPPSQVASEP